MPSLSDGRTYGLGDGIAGMYLSQVQPSESGSVLGIGVSGLTNVELVSAPLTTTVANTGWAFAQGGRTGANAVTSYATADAAAIAVLREIVPKSQKLGGELGGSICRLGSRRYSYTAYATGSASEVFTTPCTPSSTTVAIYHTHIGPLPEDQPSGGDILNRYLDGLVGYIGVSTDVTDNQPVDCAPQGKGNIWKFQMDTSVPFRALNPVYRIVRVIACTPTGR